MNLCTYLVAEDFDLALRERFAPKKNFYLSVKVVDLLKVDLLRFYHILVCYQFFHK